ncbi:hypothetical protein IV203_036284 [Nitzschia inconspicua]|uniref:Uncharacterized protein n=1 Tax=Nitzschia inconspicua TaxID=303405 RepID=A0A9K3PXW2_9STRA|nr:hypothetical protein IV203_036284 [Nitzschia inconspicua]
MSNKENEINKKRPAKRAIGGIKVKFFKSSTAETTTSRTAALSAKTAIGISSTHSQALLTASPSFLETLGTNTMVKILNYSTADDVFCLAKTCPILNKKIFQDWGGWICEECQGPIFTAKDRRATLPISEQNIFRNNFHLGCESCQQKKCNACVIKTLCVCGETSCSLNHEFTPYTCSGCGKMVGCSCKFKECVCKDKEHFLAVLTGND